MGRQALTDDAREARRQELLAAARQLYRARGTLPPVADIAVAAGLAKGTVYLYFRTKEEIFVALLEDAFGRLFAQLLPALAALPRKKSAIARSFAQTYAAMVADSGDLLPLAALANGVLEQNLPVEPMRRFKAGLAQGLAHAGQQLEAHTGLHPAGAGESLLLQTYALTLGLWQALSYPTGVRALLTDAGLDGLTRDFSAELPLAVERLWLGYFPAAAS
ncbi:TetR/AcrR family transcriptional regulator [Massilia arenosa]|uniref:TetR/AcrR family transcriptional regulator n=1 Tax=Zemynaea arenosa TaxID=2561931 RepID=A0A4Y9SLX3_9BURK|nr:TetR family transcriptional regulator [Massilia arenosa]TFW22912.1 TetR/AcrR family transcriptional regulator [Massilia arenosa]